MQQTTIMNIAGAKVDDTCGIYDIDDKIVFDINVALCAFLNTHQSIDEFDSFEPDQENFDLFLTLMTEYSTDYKTASDTIHSSKFMSGDRIMSRCRGASLEIKIQNQEFGQINEDDMVFSDESDDL
mgnify:CR=1 FL=1